MPPLRAVNTYGLHRRRKVSVDDGKFDDVFKGVVLTAPDDDTASSSVSSLNRQS